jgi:glycosyltransferase involved in cell wall biosynthesis
MESQRVAELVSVAVPAYNNEKTIVECVQSLVKQEYRPVEILVVDDGSTDGTAQRVVELIREFRNVRLIRIDHSGPSHARNVGVRQSAGGYLLFADGDAVYHPDYLAEGIRVMTEDRKIGAVCMMGTIWLRKSTFVSRGIALEFEIKQRFLRSGKWRPYFAFFYRREAVEKVGGFDEELFQSEDKDLFHRVKSAGYSIGLVDDFTWSHLYPQDLRSLAARSYRGGRQRVVYIFKKRMYGELLRRTAGLWCLGLLIVLSALSLPAALLTAGILVASYSYKAYFTLRNAWGGTGRLVDMLLFPVVSAVRYLSGAVGYSKGTAVYVLRQMAGKKTTWSDV